jgi:muramoyltetrapeptide carboxypeptidase
MLHACAAAGRLRVPPGAVLVLEDVGERPYRLDRMITTLAVGGYLGDLRAIVLGEFEHCEAGPDGVGAEQVLAEQCARLGVPIVAGFPVGHGDRNEPFVLGAMAHVLAEGPSATLVLS